MPTSARQNVSFYGSVRKIPRIFGRMDLSARRMHWFFMGTLENSRLPNGPMWASAPTTKWENVYEFAEWPSLFAAACRLTSSWVRKMRDCNSHAFLLFEIISVKPEGIYLVSAAVSCAIMSSSLVGMTQTVTLESGVEITTSSPRSLFFSGSSLTPRYSRPSQIDARMEPEFSPTPAVKTMQSTPPSAAA